MAAARPRSARPLGRPWLAVASRARLGLLVGASALIGAAPVGTERLATARLVAPAPMPLPGYLQQVTDPAFGTPLTRVTDPGRPMGAGIVCAQAYCTHRYSSAQAWNADQSLLLVANGCSGFCFLDGQTYVPLFRRSGANECEWHPVDPHLMICTGANAIYSWAPRENVRTILFTAEGYGRLEFGPNKGNLSWDGKRMAVKTSDRRGNGVVFGYDLASGRKFPDISLAAMGGRSHVCTISPTGLYILCMHDLEDGTEQASVYTIEGQPVQKWSEHHRPGHGDMTIDADGSDVYVGISKSPPDLYHVIKRRLRDGVVTDLAPYGEAQHVSIRNTRLPGWAFVTYSGTYAELLEHPSWAPFQQEVVALRIDGSGEIRRIVQTRDAPHDYWSEAHASPSPDGSQIVWSSNWGEAGGPVSDFVARVTWPEIRRAEPKRLAH